MSIGNGNDETQFGGDDATQAGGTPPATPEGSDNRSKLWLIVGGVVLVGLLIGAGIAVAGGGDDDKKETADRSSTSSSTPTSTSTTTATAPSQTNGGGGGSGGSGGGGGGTTPTTPSDDPVVTSLSMNRSSPANCTPSAPDVSVPIDPSVYVTLSWTTENATSTQLYINGGLYDSYGPSGSESRQHPCSDATYTYRVVAKGPNGPDASREISLTVNNTSQS